MKKLRLMKKKMIGLQRRSPSILKVQQRKLTSLLRYPIDLLSTNWYRDTLTRTVPLYVSCSLLLVHDVHADVTFIADIFHAPTFQKEVIAILLFSRRLVHYQLPHDSKSLFMMVSRIRRIRLFWPYMSSELAAIYLVHVVSKLLILASINTSGRIRTEHRRPGWHYSMPYWSLQHVLQLVLARSSWTTADLHQT